MDKFTIPGGHVLMARQTSNSRIWLKGPLYLKCWLWILFMANHTEQEKKGYVYKRGEFITTYNEIIQAMSYYHNRKNIIPTVKQIRVMLDWLVFEGMIKVQPICDFENRTSELPNRGRPTVLTGAYIGIKIIVVNYDTYQTSENYRGRHKGRPSSSQGHNNNNDNKKNIYMSNFELFYKAYPKHQARKKAFEAWGKIKPSDDLLETILISIEKQKEHKKVLKSKGEFVPEWPLPATWLNGQRWEDEILGSPENIRKEEPLFCPSCGRRIVIQSDLRGEKCVYCFKTTEVKT